MDALLDKTITIRLPHATFTNLVYFRSPPRPPPRRSTSTPPTDPDIRHLGWLQGGKLDCLDLKFDLRLKIADLSSLFYDTDHSAPCRSNIILHNNYYQKPAMAVMDLVLALSSALGMTRIHLDDVSAVQLNLCKFNLNTLKLFLPPFRSYYNQFGFIDDSQFTQPSHRPLQLLDLDHAVLDGNSALATNRTRAQTFLTCSQADLDTLAAILVHGQVFNMTTIDQARSYLQTHTLQNLASDLTHLCASDNRSLQTTLEHYIRTLEAVLGFHDNLMPQNECRLVNGYRVAFDPVSFSFTRIRFKYSLHIEGLVLNLCDQALVQSTNAEFLASV